MTIAELQSLCLLHNIPFFCYRDPVEKVLKIGIQTSSPEVSEVDNLTADLILNGKGFIFSPYDINSHKRYFIKSDFLFGETVPDTIAKILQQSDFPEKKYDSYMLENQSKYEYQTTVSKIIDKINSGEVDKVVYSRTISAEINTTKDDITRIFRTLHIQNKSTFAYWIYIPGMPMWIGATPETFLRKEKHSLYTVALAGTKKNDVGWDSKNLEEHKFVSNYIENVFKQNNFKEIEKTEVETVKAGIVYHLQTRFHTKIEDDNILPKLINDLHPTPAVCGFPKKEAQKIISDYEGYDRCYYAGYLGVLYGNGNFSLYVNLRCMSIANNIVKIYVGGGITKDSQPDDEWKETNLKSQAMRKLLGYCIKMKGIRH